MAMADVRKFISTAAKFSAIQQVLSTLSCCVVEQLAAIPEKREFPLIDSSIS